VRYKITGTSEWIKKSAAGNFKKIKRFAAIRDPLSAGIYFLKLKMNNQASTVKIIIE
jgi:hypothetical protein